MYFFSPFFPHCQSICLPSCFLGDFTLFSEGFDVLRWWDGWFTRQSQISPACELSKLACPCSVGTSRTRGTPGSESKGLRTHSTASSPPGPVHPGGCADRELASRLKDAQLGKLTPRFCSEREPGCSCLEGDVTSSLEGARCQQEIAEKWLREGSISALHPPHPHEDVRARAGPGAHKKAVLSVCSCWQSPLGSQRKYRELLGANVSLGRLWMVVLLFLNQ